MTLAECAPVNFQPFVPIIASLVGAVASLTGAGIVAYFAYYQRDLARSKLKLDLYDRRFAIFKSVLAFYDAVLWWGETPTPEQKEARTRCFMAQQESGFLFTKKSGIAARVKKINEDGMKVIGFRENIKEYRRNPEFLIEEHNQANDILLRVFNESIEKLRGEMHEYLDFSKVL